MDTSVPDIIFDSVGICNYCQNLEYRKKNEVKKISLNHIIDKIKKDGKDKKYDCIIGISGGVDSSYVAHIIKEKGLRALAVHLDNGWNSNLAVSNIENLLRKLDIDLYTYVIDWLEFKDTKIIY